MADDAAPDTPPKRSHRRATPPPAGPPEVGGLEAPEVDGGKPDTPPRGGRRAPGRPVGSRTRRSLAPRLEEAYGTIGLLVVFMDAEDGRAILEGAPRAAAALDAWARDNDAVYKLLERLLTSGAIAGVVTAHLAIAVPIAAHHGLLPPAIGTLLGVRLPTDGNPSARPGPTGVVRDPDPGVAGVQG